MVSGRNSKYYKRINAISGRSKRIRKQKKGFNINLSVEKKSSKKEEIKHDLSDEEVEVEIE